MLQIRLVGLETPYPARATTENDSTNRFDVYLTWVSS
jgi:hypothetical protein